MGKARETDSRDDCHVRPDLIAIPATVGQVVARSVSNRGILSPDEMRALVVSPDDDAKRQTAPSDDEPPDDDVVTSLAELVTVLRVDDPFEAARQLNERGVAASPIHAVGFESHGSVMNAIEPIEAKTPVEGKKMKTRGTVAVVDSGIVARESLPDWMGRDYVTFTGADVETPDGPYPVKASHGTFVTSLYRQYAPEFRVSLASARSHSGDPSVLRPVPDAAAPAPSDELRVLDAVVRLINRHHHDKNEVRALNLSLGAYRCGDCCSADSYLLLLRMAIDEWRRHFGRSVPIFAAGGNIFDRRPVYPAAFPCVRGVGALARGFENQVVWSEGSPVDAPYRAWVDDVSIGHELSGLSGQDPEHSIIWSGSSFATARAGAKVLMGDPFESVVDGVTWWERP